MWYIFHFPFFFFKLFILLNFPYFLCIFRKFFKRFYYQFNFKIDHYYTQALTKASIEHSNCKSSYDYLNSSTENTIHIIFPISLHIVYCTSFISYLISKNFDIVILVVADFTLFVRCIAWVQTGLVNSTQLIRMQLRCCFSIYHRTI